MREKSGGKMLYERHFSISAMTDTASYLLFELPHLCRGPRSGHDLWMVTANNKLMMLSKVISA